MTRLLAVPWTLIVGLTPIVVKHDALASTIREEATALDGDRSVDLIESHEGAARLADDS